MNTQKITLPDHDAVIFDMDGTLVDSMGFWKRLAFEYLESHGVKKVSAEILERIKPMTMTESAALFISEYGLLGTPESVAADMNTMMDEHYRNDIPLKPGVKEYLTKLKSAGVRMCVASATAEPVQEDTAEEQPADTNTYTDDMTIEEITQRMSVDEARSIVVTFGTCKGWTLAQVADRRPASLRWYVKGYQGENNILRAAAAIIWDSLQEKQAG